MNGQLAALMALALHGNAWLADPVGAAPSLHPANTAFRSVHDLRIDDTRGRLRPREVRFADTALWFAHLRASRVARLSLVDVPSPPGPLAAPAAAAVPNAIPWSLVGTARRHRPVWCSRWDTRGDDAWDMRLQRTELPPQGTVAAVGVDRAASDLAAALDAVTGFAVAQGLSNWRQRFETARTQLSAAHPQVPGHHDIAPAGVLDPARERLLAAAMHAWCFDGAGTWAEAVAGETDPGEFARGTRRLYAAVMAAFLAVTNARPVR